MQELIGMGQRDARRCLERARQSGDLCQLGPPEVLMRSPTPASVG